MLGKDIPQPFIVVFVFKTGSHFVAQVGLELVIHLP
jgi:hypothetical protein